MSEPVLSTRHLVKSFGSLRATDDVSIDVMPGEIHAVIGPNGAGKSTLIGQICGSLTPDAGRVVLKGQDVSGLGAAERSKAGLARTFQISQLAMEDTVETNVLLGAIGSGRGPFRFWAPAVSDAQALERVRDALSQTGLSDHASTLCANLSHGQRRQLEVAVALVTNPAVFVMDEPMAGLGAEGSKEMTKLLDTLRFKAPILLVEHDMDAVFALADRISVLVYGKVIATGTADEIRTDRTVQEAYLGESL